MKGMSATDYEDTDFEDDFDDEFEEEIAD